jgi:hypothetical protein
MTFLLLSNVPQYNTCMLYIGQMLCISALQLHVGTAVNLVDSQDTTAINTCLGLQHTAFHLMHSPASAPIPPSPLNHNTSVRLHWSSSVSRDRHHVQGNAVKQGVPLINPEHEPMSCIADWEDLCVCIQYPGPRKVCMEPAAEGLQERQ